MDLSTLSRRELQALCKSNGIPANKTNVFMVDALAKKRVPLSKMDSNRDQKPVTSIGSPLLKSPPLLAMKNTACDVNSSGPNQQKPPLFQNNFLRRGKRKDAPTLHVSDHEEKQKVASSNAQQPHQMASTKTETSASQPLRPNPMVSARAKADNGLNSETLSGAASGTATRHSKVESRLRTGNHSGTAAKGANGIATSSDDSTFDGSRNGAKGNIEDRVHSQIDAALCAKVMKSSAPEQHGDVLEAKVVNCEVLRIPLGHPEQQMASFYSKQPLAFQIATIEEKAPTSTAATHAVQRSALLERIAPPSPISSSPLVRVEEKVRSIVERVQSFWKGSKDLAVVKSSGSPVQEVVIG